MYELKVKGHFDAAHFIKDYPGKCKNMHGHRWEVEVRLQVDKLDHKNMAYDFANIKGILSMLVSKLDHLILNDVLEDDNVTAELIARGLYKKVKGGIAWGGIDSVTVWEGPDCGERNLEGWIRLKMTKGGKPYRRGTL